MFDHLRLRVLAPLLAVALLSGILALAGCGGGGGGSTTTTTTSGDVNSVIQAFGSAAPKAQLTQATATADAYLGAVGEGKWDKACSNLTSLSRSKFTALGNKSPTSKGKGCAGGLETVLSHAPKGTFSDATPIAAVALRVRKPVGFLFYRNSAGDVYRLVMKRDGGEWKVASPFAIPLG